MKTAEHAINQHPHDYRKHFNLHLKSTHHPCLSHQLTKHCTAQTSKLPFLLHLSQLLAFKEKKMSRSHPRAKEIDKEYWLQYLCYMPHQFQCIQATYRLYPFFWRISKMQTHHECTHSLCFWFIFVDFFVRVFKP